MLQLFIQLIFENFLIGQREDSDHIARTYKENVNWPRSTLHKGILVDRAMSTGQLLESFSDVGKFFVNRYRN